MAAPFPIRLLARPTPRYRHSGGYSCPSIAVRAGELRSGEIQRETGAQWEMGVGGRHACSEWLLNVVLGLLTALLGTVLGIVAAVVMLLGAVLCVTILLIPLGIPVIRLSRRLFTLAGKMMHVP